jgi:hypothetical protein
MDSHVAGFATNSARKRSLAENIFSSRHKTSRLVITLNRIKALVDWSQLEKTISVIDKTQQGVGGRPRITLAVAGMKKEYGQIVPASTKRKSE